MRLDFWQVSEGPVERVVAQIAPRVLDGNERMLVVEADAERRAAISGALWAADGFLAHGEDHAERQPILLAETCRRDNGAAVAVLADGKWRDEAAEFDRTIVLFGEPQVAEARALWRQFDGRDDVQRSYFAQEDGRWVKKT
ncbi:DNA polymerase III subunit chi [Tsuneonella dongtanensis]|uniref:DNA polymerase III subunit chi n=1 Tax=Tsuneonella dongtanensis TaxID=692370 RepID=A0A1B2ADP3_9SPHN|nr:DNA polymerase III subunit chi [Tsuneonella dongtanensis]ANY20280.1 DNA polymerase III subunit chi [Tsuneonella dongtanensis]